MEKTFQNVLQNNSLALLLCQNQWLNWILNCTTALKININPLEALKTIFN